MHCMIGIYAFNGRTIIIGTDRKVVRVFRLVVIYFDT